ncbi:hypothetical protein [Eudoraea sp.]|uniref:hypothetical protein n=1 Tax=Eudoraea sp. TaxID=1979955 RepID=UPI003C76924B
MKKDNIDKLYQEKLKNFNEVPDEKVWKAISNSLDKKKKSRPIIPIWWKLGGVAAILAILLYVFIPFKSDQNTDQIITDVESAPSLDNSRESDVENILPAENNEDGSSVVNSSEVTTESGNSNSASDTNKSAIGGQNIETSIATSSEKPNMKTERNNSDNSKTTEAETTNTFVRSENTPHEVTKDEITKNIKAQQNPETETTEIAANINPPVKNSVLEVEDTTISNNIQKDTPLKEAVVADGATNLIEKKEEEDLKSTMGKKSIYDEIEKSQETKVAQTNSNKWSVGPSIAPVYFNSFGDGSPIHSNFVSNSKSGNVNLSYGLMVSYDINKKLSIRSGLHKVDYGYDTNEISFSASLTASTNDQINNINYAPTSKNLVVRNMEDSNLSEQASSMEIAAQSPTRSGRMIQNFGYLELPLELNYALLDNKFGINVIGGLSSLFLVDNSVVLEANGNTVEMGEANNINDVNLSTNIGFGFNYKFSPTFQLNLEPMFKYQLNTFNETSGNFQPFSIGVYTGLNFKF